MLVPLVFRKRGSFAQDQARRGYHVAYRGDEVNRCPGCGRSHWHVGRLTAECGFCGTALPLTESLGMAGTGLFRTSGRGCPGFATAA